MRFILLFLIIILFSGCIQQLNDVRLWIETWTIRADKQFGFDIINVEEKTINVGVSDVLVIQSISSIPESPILPKQWVFLTYVFKNIGKKPISNVRISLYDAPKFTNNLGEPCNVGNRCKPEILLCAEEHPCVVNPDAEQQVRFRLISPEVSEKSYATISARLKYSYATETTYSFSVINKREIERRQREGKMLTITNEKSISDGPVYVDIWLMNTKYGIGGNDLVIAFQIKEHGTGTLVNTQVEPNNLVIYLPKELLSTNNIEGVNIISVAEKDNGFRVNKKDFCIKNGIEKLGNMFFCNKVCFLTNWNGLSRTCTSIEKCEPGSGIGYCANNLKCCVPIINKLTNTRDYDMPYIACMHSVCRNIGILKLHNKASTPIYIKLKNITTPEVMKTFVVKAFVRYDYELRTKTTLEVKPYG